MPLADRGLARLGSARLGSARLGSARLGSARLGYFQPIAFEEFHHVFPAVGLVFSTELRLLRLPLGLDFGSTNLPLNFLRAPSRSRYYSTPRPVLELFSQNTLPVSFHLLVSRALFL